MSAGSVSHEWARARFGAWAAGILDDAEHGSMEAHLAECERCRAAARELQEVPPAGGQQHIPTPMLASWNRVAPKVSGEMRELIAHHLDRCPDCRRELESLGLDPGLIRQPRSEPTPETAPGVRARGRIFRLARDLPEIAGRFRWAQRWAIAAVLVLVAIPAGIYMLGQRRTPEAPIARSPDEAGQPPASNEVASQLAMGPQGQGVTLSEGTYRGTAPGSPVPVVSFDPIRHEIAFVAPGTLALAEGDRVRLAVLDDTGRTRLSLETTMSDLFPAGGSRSIVVRQGHPPLEAGRYTLSIIVQGRTGSAPEETRYPFEIR